MYLTLGGPLRRIAAAVLVGSVISLATGRRMGLVLWWKPFAAGDVATIARLHAEGRLKPAIDSRYPLEQAAEALRQVDDGLARGKVLVIPG